MTYVRIAIIAIVVLLIGWGVAFYYTFSDGKNIDNALNAFLDGNNAAAKAALQNSESRIPPSQYYLYLAYIDRAENKLAESDRDLQRAMTESVARRQMDFLYEIYLNQALNGYLQNNPKAILQALLLAEKAGWTQDGWIVFFKGIEEFQQGHCRQALQYWEMNFKREPLSLWMKKAFDAVFSPLWLALYRGRCEIEQGNFLAARQALEKERANASANQLNEIDFLIGLSYAKEAQSKPPSATTPYYKLAFSYFSRVPMQQERYADDRKRIIDELQREVIARIDGGSLQDLAFYIQVMEAWKAQNAINEIGAHLSLILDKAITSGNWKQTQELTEILNRTLPKGDLRETLSQHFLNLVETALDNGAFNDLDKYWTIAKQFSSDPTVLSVGIANMTTSKIYGLIPLDDDLLSVTMPYIHFWQSLEKDHKMRWTFANQLVAIAYHLWLKANDPAKALTLLKTAAVTPSPTEQQAMIDIIEQKIERIYATALHEDSVSQLPYILEVIKALQLKNINVSDPTEMANQLEDAQYLFNNRRYNEAKKKASWVLKLDPTNQKAIRIVGLSEYYEADYADALPHIKALKTTDPEVLQALMISEILKGNSVLGKQLLANLQSKQPFTLDVWRQLGFGALLNNEPSQSILWFGNISPMNDEIKAGMSYAHYEKHEWAKAVEYFNHLSAPYSKLEGLQGVAALSLAEIGDMELAEEMIHNMIQQDSFPKVKSFSPIFQTFIDEKLSILSRYFTAGYFYKHFKHDNEKALEYFSKIETPSLEALLERADTLLSMGRTSEARDDLKNAFILIGDEDFQLSQPMAILLASICARAEFYPEAVRYYNLYFSDNPNQMEGRDAYADALRQLHLFTPALQQYRILEKGKQLNAENRLALIDCLIHTDQFPEAVKMSKAWLAEEPPPLLLTKLELAKLLFITGEQNTIDEILAKVPDRERRTTDENIALLELWVEMGDYQKALDLASAEQARLEKSSKGLMALASLASALSDNKKGIGFAQAALRLNPSDPAPSRYISRYGQSPELLKKEYDRLYQQLMEDINNVSIELALARNLIEQTIEASLTSQGATAHSFSGLQKAHAVLDNVISENKEIPEAYLLLGNVFFLLNDNDQAENVYAQSLKFDPSYEEAYKHLALIDAEQGQLKEAIANTERALKFAPNDAEAWALQSKLLEQTGDLKKAHASLLQALKFRPNEGQLYLKLGLFEIATYQAKEARDAFWHAYILEPSREEALKYFLITADLKP